MARYRVTHLAPYLIAGVIERPVTDVSIGPNTTAFSFIRKSPSPASLLEELTIQLNKLLKRVYVIKKGERERERG